MQRAEMTAFTDASAALSTNISWRERLEPSRPEQHIQSPCCFLYLIIIDDIRTFVRPTEVHYVASQLGMRANILHWIFHIYLTL